MIQKNDFVEIEYTAKVKDGEIFDTNIAEDAKKINIKIEPKPLVICIGQNMILVSIDSFLIGKEPGNYTLELKAEKAFGFRKKELIKTMPLSTFQTSETKPYPGAVFAFDNMLGKITSISGGRVIVDFNNPIAGKDVVYQLKIKKIVNDEKEKVKALMLAFFGSELPFKLENNKIIIEVNKGFKQLFLAFSQKFKEILNLELEVSESKDSDDAQKSDSKKISDINEKEKKEKEEEKK